MRRSYEVLLLALLLVLLLIPGRGVISQAPASCPQIVQFALDTTGQVCSGVGENQACYGHVLVDAIPRPGVEDFQFEDEGDVAELFAVETLRLSPMNVEVGTWGVALINMQAYLQYARPENVTFLLFGDVQIEDTYETLSSIQVRVRANEFVNARIGPSADSGVIETLMPGQMLTAQGRSADNAWIRVVLPVTRRIGWVSRHLLTTDGDFSMLRVVEDSSDFFGPMQAFYFQSGVDDAYCPESPESGLLVQTPEGVAEVTLLINEVSIDMQATAFLQAQSGNRMTVGVIDGWAEVESNGQRQPVFAGTQVSVPLDSMLGAAGAPSDPAPYEVSRLQALPLGMLGKTVALADALSDAEIAARLSAWANVGLATYDGSPNTTFYTEDGVLMVIGEDGVPVPADSSGVEILGGPRGLDGVLPPGMGGDNPGQDDASPPGQAKKD